MSRTVLEIIEEKGWSRDETADKAGINRKTLTNFIGSGTPLGEENLRKLARVLGVRVDEIEKIQPKKQESGVFRDVPPTIGHDSGTVLALQSLRLLATHLVEQIEFYLREAERSMRKSERVSSTKGDAAEELLAEAEKEEPGQTPE